MKYRRVVIPKVPDANIRVGYIVREGWNGQEVRIKVQILDRIGGKYRVIYPDTPNEPTRLVPIYAVRDIKVVTRESHV